MQAECTQSKCLLNHFSCVQLFATLWAVAHQAPLSVGFFRPEYCSALSCPPPGALPDPWIEPASLASLHCQVGSLLLVLPGTSYRLSKRHQQQQNQNGKILVEKIASSYLLSGSYYNSMTFMLHLCIIIIFSWCWERLKAKGKPRGSGWRGRWEGGSGWGTHVKPWLFHFNVWQNPLKKKKKKDSITDSVDTNLSKFWKTVEDREAWHAAVHEVTKNLI